MKRTLLLGVLLAVIGNAFAQDAATFKKWGDETLDMINTNFRTLPNRTYLYREKLPNGAAAYCWPHGIILKAFIHADMIQDAENLYNEFHNNYFVDIRGYKAYNAVIGGKNDRYYDDNAWIAKDLIYLYTKTKKSVHLERAKMVTEFCMSGERPQGGIRFHESHSDPSHEKHNQTATCSTAPVSVTCLKIYKETKEEKYLTDGKRLYDFMKGQPWTIGDGARGYENAVIMQAALLLYEITEEEVYLADAKQLGYSMAAFYTSWDSHKLNEYAVWGGHDMTDAYVHMYETDQNSYWLTVAAGYLTYLHDYCKDDQGFYTPIWNGSHVQKDGKDEPRFLMMDQASAAAAYYRMSTTPGGDTERPEPVAIFREKNYNKPQEGNKWSIGLLPGNYTMSDLVFLGHITPKFLWKTHISSVMVKSGYKITLYDQDNFGGNSVEYTEDTPELGASWNDKAVSVKVELIGNSIGENQTDINQACVYPTYFTDVLNIKNLHSPAMITVFDISGKVLFTTETAEKSYTINTGSFPMGICIARIKMCDREQVVKIQKID